MRTRPLASILEATCDAILDLTLFPSVLEADSNGAYVLGVMGEDALRTRSRGPYTPENLPSEVVSTIRFAALRWSVKPERPEFTIEGGGRWPRLLMVLPHSKVSIRFVVPEDAPPIPQPAPHNAGPGGDIRLALEFVVRTLDATRMRTGKEPPLSLRLGFPEDPDYDSKVASVPDEWADLILPVIPTIQLDRRRCSRGQRKAHDDAVRTVAYTGQTIDPLGRHGFTTWLGSARVQDPH